MTVEHRGGLALFRQCHFLPAGSLEVELPFSPAEDSVVPESLEPLLDEDAAPEPSPALPPPLDERLA